MIETPARSGVRLPLAALQLQRSYNSTLRLVLTGRLEGWQEEGKWFVSLASMEKLIDQEPSLPRSTP